MTQDDDDRAALHQLAYEESGRVLADQARTLEQLRVRMAAVLATASTVTAFLVGTVARADASDQDCWYWIGVVLGTFGYATVVVLTVRVLKPKYEWRFNMSPKVIVEGYAILQPLCLKRTACSPSPTRKTLITTKSICMRCRSGSARP